MSTHICCPYHTSLVLRADRLGVLRCAVCGYVVHAPLWWRIGRLWHDVTPAVLAAKEQAA